MVESSNGLDITASSTTTVLGHWSHRIFHFVSTWILRFGSVSVGLIAIAGTVLYLQQDNLLVRFLVHTVVFKKVIDIAKKFCISFPRNGLISSSLSM